jgi:hypothetical protein
LTPVVWECKIAALETKMDFPVFYYPNPDLSIKLLRANPGLYSPALKKSQEHGNYGNDKDYVNDSSDMKANVTNEPENKQYDCNRVK